MLESPFLIDAHAHINFRAYKDDADAVIARAAAEGIWMLAVGSQIDTSRRAVQYAERYPHIWAVVGLHPIHLIDAYVDEQEVDATAGDGRIVSGTVTPGDVPRIQFRTRRETFDADAYRTLATHPRTVAIGECGIDRYRIPEREDLGDVVQCQDATFRAQITLAQSVDLPLVVHVRDGEPDVGRSVTGWTFPYGWWEGHEATIRLLTETRAGWRRDPPFGLIHCYSGTWSQAQRYLDLGFNISFTGIITFRPTRTQQTLAEELWRTVRGVPLDRFHVETDCPYLTPEPHRGERNEPRFVRHVAERVAELKGVPLAVVAARSVENTHRLFRKMGA